MLGDTVYTYNILATQSDAHNLHSADRSNPRSALTPLPTEYWSRPIYATNYQWAQLGGNWWGLGKPAFTDTGGYDASGNNFNPYSQAPNSAHIMWVKPTAFGGQVGNQSAATKKVNIHQPQFYTDNSSP